VRVTYNHPVKELVWCITKNASGGKQLWDFTQNVSKVNNILLTTNPVFAKPSSNVSVPITYATGSPMQFFNSEASGVVSQWCEEGSELKTSHGPLSQFKLIINGQDRMKINSGKYFNQMQPFNHHSGNPYPGIYSYSFALKPEEHQPSGTCNFSRVDNSQAYIVLKDDVDTDSFLEMFAINYNVLRIQSGMGGLAFSN
jgi:hypothetical protein